MKNSFLRAVFTLVGTTIGAGIFGIPFVISRIGFFPGALYLSVLALLTLVLNLMYGEVILRTDGDHQLTGYCGIYLGKRGKRTAVAALLISLYGALLAYLLQIGVFLNLLLPQLPAGVWSLLFFALASAGLLRGLRVVSEIETLLVGLFLLIVGLFLFYAGRLFEPANLTGFDSGTLFLPFGVILFALSGSSVLPEVEEILRKRHSRLKSAIVLGTLLPAVVYLMFAFSVVGISGRATSEDAVSGLAGALPVGVVDAGLLLGVLTMGTSFISLSFVAREVWFRDFELNKRLAWILALLPPPLLLFAGFSSFIGILQFTGGVLGGLVGLLIGLLYLSARRLGKKEPAYSLNIPRPLVYFIIAIFLLGGTATIFY